MKMSKSDDAFESSPEFPARGLTRYLAVPCAGISSQTFFVLQMQTIFHHNQSGSVAFTDDLHVKEVHRAISLHPVKTSQHLHRIENYYTANSIHNLHHEILQLQREIKDMDSYLDKKEISVIESVIRKESLLDRFHPKNPRELLEWTFFTKSLYSRLDYNPKRGLQSSLKWSISNLVMELMDLINQYSQQRGRIVDFRDLLYGYQRLDPLHGVQYVLDLHLVYKRYAGRKMTAPVRRHSYLEQAFSWTEITEEHSCVGHQPFPYDLDRDFGGDFRYFANYVDVNLKDVTDRNCHKFGKPQTVNLILPLSGRLTIFHRFLRMLDEEFFARNDAVALTVVNFVSPSDSSNSSSVQDAMGLLEKKYPGQRIELLELDRPFSRAVGLQEGLLKLPQDALLFFVDVDMAFDREFIQSVRENTKMGRMVYYPVVFSQYAPDKETNSHSGESDLLPQWKVNYTVIL